MREALGVHVTNGTESSQSSALVYGMEPMGCKGMSFGHGLARSLAGAASYSHDLIYCTALAQLVCLNHLVLTGKFHFSFHQKEKNKRIGL